MFVNGWGGLKLSSTLAFNCQASWISMGLCMMAKPCAGLQSAICASTHRLLLEKSYGSLYREYAMVSSEFKIV